MPRRRKERDPRREQVIKDFIDYYKPETAQDIQECLKDLLGGTFESFLKAELENHIEEEKDDGNYSNSKNGYSSKTLKSSYGAIPIDVPRDRNATFEPVSIKKHQTDISDLEQKVISMYARGMTQRDIEEHIKEIYGFSISDSQVSQITDKIMPEIIEWQNKPLDVVYPIVFLDAIHYHVKQDGAIVKKAVYNIMGYNLDGQKEILGIWIGENESAKFWLSVLNELKRRGVGDILICCIDGLTGFKQAINAVYPETVIQRCIIHQIRSSTKYVSYKDIKALMVDMKKIYTAESRETAEMFLQEFEEKWGNKYSACTSSWQENWAELSAYFDYPKEIRKVIYTTNAIEGYHRQLRKVTKNRSVFPNDNAVIKLLYLATKNAEKKWTSRVSNWGPIMNQFKIIFGDRMDKVL